MRHNTQLKARTMSIGRFLFLRFSLGTFLLLITLLCIWMAVLVNRAQRVRCVIDIVEEMGGQITFLHQKTKSGGFIPDSQVPGPAWLHRLVGSEYFVDVARILFPDDPFKDTLVTDKDLERLCKRARGLSNLEALSIGNCEELSNITALKGLCKLQRLHLFNCNQISDINALRNLRNLKLLELSGAANLSDFNVLQDLTGLTELYLSDCGRLADISPIQSLINLEQLSLSDCTAISDIDVLQGLTNLQYVDLFGTQVAAAAISDLQEVKPKCHILR